MRYFGLSLLLLTLGLMACQSNQPVESAQPPATVMLVEEVKHPTPTHTSIPPTATPTNTPRPTFTPTSAQPVTPVPTPAVSAYLTESLESSTARLDGLVTGIFVNLRTGPGLDYDIVGRVYQNDTVEIIGRTEDNAWWQVCCSEEGETAWMTDQFLRPEGDPSQIEVTFKASDAPSEAAIPAEDLDLTVTVIGDVVNLRRGPGTNYEIVGKARLDETLTIVGRNTDSSWWQVCCILDTENLGWIIDEFVETRFSPEQVEGVVPIVEVDEPASQTTDDPPTPDPVTPQPNTELARSALVSAQPESSTGGGSVDAKNLPDPGNFSPVGGDTNPLTGLPFPANHQGKRPVIVCINNDAAARPQFGLSQADVMYEYLMEGYSITRFSGIFLAEAVPQIGPVRSARLVNFYMGALYDAPLFCSGASDQVRFILKNEAPFPYLDVDLDDPANNKYTASIGQDYRTRVRTGTEGLRRWLVDWVEDRAGQIRGFTFGSVPAGGLPAETLVIPYPNVTGSRVAYRYDGTSGRYLRSLGDDPHRDSNTDLQLGLDNVIVQYISHGVTDIVEDSLGSTSIRLNLFGSGRSIVFRDGLAFEGTWHSSHRGDTPRFFDQAGAEIPLKPGKTWISIVPTRYEIEF